MGSLTPLSLTADFGRILREIQTDPTWISGLSPQGRRCPDGITILPSPFSFRPLAMEIPPFRLPTGSPAPTEFPAPQTQVPCKSGH